MSATSTPTPWYAQYNGYYWDITTAPEQYSPFFASVFSPENVRDGQANAAHIVKCVNAHDALVDALRAVISDLEYKEHDGWMSGAVHGDAYDKARAVLAGIEVTP